MSHHRSEAKDARGITYESIKVNAFKKSARVTKCGRSFTKLLEATAKFPINMNNSDDPSNPLLQVLLSLSTYTIKEYFYHLGRNIGEFPDQNKWMVAVEIV